MELCSTILIVINTELTKMILGSIFVIPAKARIPLTQEDPRLRRDDDTYVMLAVKMAEKKTSSKEKVIAGRYLIEKKLGAGGGGSVYLARDLSAQGQKVALKVVPLKKKQDPAVITALKNEFATLTLLHHRNLAAVHDFGVT